MPHFPACASLCGRKNGDTPHAPHPHRTARGDLRLQQIKYLIWLEAGYELIWRVPGESVLNEPRLDSAKSATRQVRA
jgi:hypothetical protein